MANGNADDGVKTAAFRWLFGQEATTVVLFLILGAIGWMSKYAIDIAVPAHLKQIQDGYERIVVIQNEQMKTQGTIFDRATERLERSSVSQERLLREIFAEQKLQGIEQRVQGFEQHKQGAEARSKKD